MDLRAQFSKPSGPLGWLAGQIMARRNRERSEFVLALVDCAPSDRVLEIGFGPGMDIQRLSRTAAFVAGVDHSSLMLSQAGRRNGAAIREGRVKLELGTANALPFPDAHFDKIFAINSAQFWKDLATTLEEVRRVLKPGGMLALAIQPRNKNATDQHAFQAGKGFADAMKKAGFENIVSESRQTAPVSTVCVIGRAPVGVPAVSERRS
ncbi:MAG TPA: class I SAM-dependent methyltransferase [Bryobacteraceae bacterium]|nr:class I SAM-dependent methyltransferase [Bryobacteraceae bacterium]